MEISLEDSKPSASHQLQDEPFKVTYPLNGCVEGLKQKFHNIAQVHQERLEQVKSQIICASSKHAMLIICRTRSSPGIILFTSRT